MEVMTRIGWHPGDFGDESYSITVDAAKGILSYSRQSDERLLGIFGQEQEIADWAEREGYTVVGEAQDVGVHSQSAVNDRPALTAVVTAIEEGRADGVAVHRLDRLARNFAIQDDAMQKIWQAGGRVFSTDYGEWKPDKPGDSQWTTRRAYAMRAEEEYHAILARLQEGRRRKMARGGYGGGGRIRRKYGVALVQIQGKWEYRPIPEEQEIIRRISETFVIERPDTTTVECVPTTYATVARILNNSGVPTATGAPWSKKVVRDLALRGPDKPVVLPRLSRATQPIRWAQDKRASA